MQNCCNMHKQNKTKKFDKRIIRIFQLMWFSGNECKVMFKSCAIFAKKTLSKNERAIATETPEILSIFPYYWGVHWAEFSKQIHWLLQYFLNWFEILPPTAHHVSNLFQNYRKSTLDKNVFKFKDDASILKKTASI